MDVCFLPGPQHQGRLVCGSDPMCRATGNDRVFLDHQQSGRALACSVCSMGCLCDRAELVDRDVELITTSYIVRAETDHGTINELSSDLEAGYRR